MEEILNKFVDFLIKETCQRCTACNPEADDHQGVVCLHQGEAVWLRSMIDDFIKEVTDGREHKS